MIKVKKISDRDGNWYWIPVTMLDVFKKKDKMLSILISGEEVDETLYSFNNTFEVYRCGSSSNITPDAFYNREVEFLK